jgi:butyrate kinase
MAERLILAVNPGGTSTKFGVYRETESLFEENIRHLPCELEKFDTTISQLRFRRDVVLETLSGRGFDIGDLTAVVGRGGAFKPLESGTYRVSRSLLDDIIEGDSLQADHPSNLGAPLAHSIAEEAGLPSFFVDPVCVDEMAEEARLSGHPLLPRISLSHALNIRMVAYKAAQELGRAFSELNLVVLHLGSGISVNAIRRGRMIDTSNANDGGPFSPQRTGALPTTGLMKLCFSGKYESVEMKKMLLKQGGLFSYLGTDHVGEAVRRAEEGDRQADLVLRAMVYQIVKEAGAMAAILGGELDAVVVTGGIAHNAWMVEKIGSLLKFLGTMLVYPGESELEALVRGVLRVLDSIEDEKKYN